jgi:hypothetical protein
MKNEEERNDSKPSRTHPFILFQELSMTYKKRDLTTKTPLEDEGIYLRYLEDDNIPSYQTTTRLLLFVRSTNDMVRNWGDVTVCILRV